MSIPFIVMMGNIKNSYYSLGLIFFGSLILFSFTECSLLSQLWSCRDESALFREPARYGYMPLKTGGYFLWEENNSNPTIQFQTEYPESGPVKRITTEKRNAISGAGIYLLESLQDVSLIALKMRNNRESTLLFIELKEDQTPQNPVPEIWRFEYVLHGTAWHRIELPLNNFVLNSDAVAGQKSSENASQPQGNGVLDLDSLESLLLTFPQGQEIDLFLDTILVQKFSLYWHYLSVSVLLPLYWVGLVLLFRPFPCNQPFALPLWVKMLFFQLFIIVTLYPKDWFGHNIHRLLILGELLCVINVIEAYLVSRMSDWRRIIFGITLCIPVFTLLILQPYTNNLLIIVLFLSVQSLPLIHYSRITGILTGTLFIVIILFLHQESYSLTELCLFAGIGFAIQFLYTMLDILLQLEISKEKLEQLTVAEYEKNRAVSSLRLSEHKMEIILNNISEAIIGEDENGQIDVFNHAAEELFGYHAAEVLHSPLQVYFPEIQRMENHSFKNLCQEEHPTQELLIRNKRGRMLNLECSMSYISSDDQFYKVYLIRDITLKKQTEKHALHTQKMEAIGKLTGGIAHNFNNILTGIIGYLSLAELKTEASVRSHISAAKTAAIRASGLIQGMLNFAREKKVHLEPVDLESLILESTNILQTGLNERINLEIYVEEDLPQVYVDTSELITVIINLCINARDAIREKMELRKEDNAHYHIIVTAQHLSRQELISYTALEKDLEYLAIRISDNGIGIKPENQERIFEPYFTTKEVGKGTGLGLASSYGIIRKFRGDMTFTSQYGFGTTFSIFLPVFESIHEFEAIRFEDRVENPNITLQTEQ